MIIKELKDEDFVNYKKPSMFIAFPFCTFKCERDCGKKMCQNSALAQSPDIFITKQKLCVRYISNKITQAIVCGGLEPMDSFEDLYSFIYTLRFQYQCDDDVVIYTGYTKEECEENNWIYKLSQLKNIVVKFGRFIPDQQPHNDEVLGVKLMSNNQYAERIS